MITLSTLKDATPQQVFDQCKHHLLTQGKKSQKENESADLNSGIIAVLSCAYKGANNTACAAGCFIGDSEYDPSFEGAHWNWLVSEKKVPSNHESLIRCLQIIHDHSDVSEWPKKLENLAIEFNLIY